MGQADMLRKAMGKKDPKVMAEAAAEAFMEGAKVKGINEKKAAKIFELMEYFAGYGFNKSHSTAYALLAYQTAYLKANYPWHFAAALLTIEAQNTDKLAVYLQECRDRGIPVLPPDINKSQLAFTVTPGGRALRPDGGEERRRRRDRVDSRRARRAGEDYVAARALRRARSAARQQARAREPGEGGRVRLVRDREGKPRVGELRARLMATIDLACEYGARRQRDRADGQAQLFGGASQDEGGADELPDGPGECRAVDRGAAARL